MMNFNYTTIIQCNTNIPGIRKSFEDFTPEELTRVTKLLIADQRQLVGKSYVLDNQLINGYNVILEVMELESVLSGFIIYENAPVQFNNMILHFSFIQKYNIFDDELRTYAKENPEYGYVMPPPPPYLSILPQDLFDRVSCQEGLVSAVYSMAICWDAIADMIRQNKAD